MPLTLLPAQICGLAKLITPTWVSPYILSAKVNWDLNSYCLDTVPIFEDHTGQNLADAIQDILASWELKPEDLVDSCEAGQLAFQRSV